MPRRVPHPLTLEDEGSCRSSTTGDDVMAAWLGVLLIVATVLATLFFR